MLNFRCSLVLDNIELTTNCSKISDFSFVTGVRDRRKSALALLPYVGPMWYARPAVEFMLHHGIIGWDDISHGFQATGRVDSAVFTRWRPPGATTAFD